MTSPDRPPDLPVPPSDRAWLRAVALVVLGAVIITAIAGLTVAAVYTDRDLTKPVAMVAGAVVLVAALGGLHVWADRRR